MAGIVRIPPAFGDVAAAFTDGRKTPAVARDSSTVILTRPGDLGPEVYLLRRQTSMDFAAGMYVFPGGGVDERDFDADIGWVGPPPTQWAGVLGTDAPTAGALVCAAVRETFEESGVLLAGTSAGSVVSDTTGEEWEVDRKKLEANELSFTEFLGRRNLVLRTDLLGAWSGWLTPIFEPKRYRTWFFVAELPAGQRTRDVSTESDRVAWLPAVEAVERAEAKAALMLPPTYVSCLDVAQFETPAQVMAEAATRRVEMFCPAVMSAGEGDWLTLSTPPYAAKLLAQRGTAARLELG